MSVINVIKGEEEVGNWVGRGEAFVICSRTLSKIYTGRMVGWERRVGTTNNITLKGALSEGSDSSRLAWHGTCKRALRKQCNTFT